MIWMALIGGSLLLHERGHVSAMLFGARLSPASTRRLALIADSLVLATTVGLFVMCVGWYDVLELARHSFDADAFAASTFNFIYQEPTNTIGVHKFWLWLVVPLVAATMSIHAAANLASTFRDEDSR
jgi:TRAP-type C4-dicarboxylate transport system permease small subunit